MPTTCSNKRKLTTNYFARLPLPWSIRRRAIAEEVRRRSTERLPERLSCIDYGRMLEVRKTPAGSDIVDNSSIISDNSASPIWQFWADGFDDLPPIVTTCVRSVTTFADVHPIVRLDAKNYQQYVTLPAHIEQKKELLGWTHFSDILRLWLLSKYGGIWIDATVLLSAPLPKKFTDLPFFAVTRDEDPFLFSTWFMQSESAHPIIITLQSLLNDYWKKNDTMIDYFLLHLMFEVAVSANSTIRNSWLNTPVEKFEPTHLLQSLLTQKFDQNVYDDVITKSWIHKLTWKLPAENLQDTFAEHIIQECALSKGNTISRHADS